MKKFTLVLVGVVLVSSVLFITSAMAWRCGTGRGMGKWGCATGSGFCWSYDVPDLTAGQSERLTALQKNFVEDTSKLRGELAMKRIELDQLLAQPQPDQTLIMATQKELTDLQSHLQQQCLHNQLEMRKILTEEQLSQLPYGCGLNLNSSAGWMRGYDYFSRQGFGPDSRGYDGHRRGCRPCW